MTEAADNKLLIREDDSIAGCIGGTWTFTLGGRGSESLAGVAVVDALTSPYRQPLRGSEPSGAVSDFPIIDRGP